MPFIRCPACKARYQVTRAAGGKRSKCSHCGQVFKIPVLKPVEAEPRLSLPEDVSGVDAIELEGVAGATASASDTGEPVDAIPITDAVAYATAPAGAAARARGAYGAYFQSLVESLAFPARMGDLITFVIVWVCLIIGNVLAPFALCLGLAVKVIVVGWYWSFQLNAVQGAAAGEKELPALTLTEGFWGDTVLPFFKMFCTYVLVWLPAVAFLATTGALNAVVASGGGVLLSPGALIGLGAALPLHTQIITGVLLLGGYFVWPILVLVIAVGGSVRGLFRVDLIARTIARSLPAYLLTVLIVYATWGLDLGFGMLLDAVRAGRPLPLGGLPSVLVLGPVLLIVELYSTIIAMRAIGLYYRHFKHKFAWTWE